MRKFSGFNPNQMTQIQQKLGYNGAPDGWESYLSSNPNVATRFSRMQDRARQTVEGGVLPTGKAPPDNQLMTQGGKVVPQTQMDPQSQTMPMQQAPTIAPQQPPQPRTGQPYNPAMPTWSSLPEGTQQPPQSFSEPTIQTPAVAPQYMAKGGDVKNPKDKTLYKDDNKAPDLTNKKNVINNPNKFITETKVNKMHVKNPQLIKDNGNTVSNTATVENTATGTTKTADKPDQLDAHTVDTATTQEGVSNALNDVQAVQGTVSDQSQVEAATALPSANATVQGQLESLMQQFEGGSTPAWAAGAMRMANAAMASRGLGNSSMAGAAVTQAAMESAISIAAQDAATFSQFEMQNLNNRQQARLQNAQSFLQMDLANLDVANQTNLFKAQSTIQSLFTDAAAENASRQFNATSQNQTDQFFSNLKTQVETFNTAQKNAMQMFNAEQKNAVKQFNATQKNAIKQFNAQNRLVIDQSNAQWRQTIATVNNASQNEANRQDAQAATGLTMAGFNNLWQNERDLMAYAFTAAENANQRAHEILLAKMGVDVQKDLADQESRNELLKAGGSFLANMFDDVDWGSIF